MACCAAFRATAARLLGQLGVLAVLWLAVAAHAGPFENTIAQRTLACTACHGEQGRAGPDGYYPRLAGKPAGYLYNQLLNFRDGRRHYGLMTRMVDVLSDGYLMDIARHFSAMQAPYPPPQPLASPPAPEVLARGRALALQGDAGQRVPACVQCHGERLTGALPDVPGLLGLPQDYLMAQLGGWRTGQRRAHAPDCMASIVQRLSDRDAYAVVSWLASQPVPAGAHPAAERPTLAAEWAGLKCGSARPPGPKP
ncbi:c-type cytochrome [Ottowia testudinis]|uniref:C-type cytochrome n=1 Tax=Ottowia testudinis TaxID=2816950 RepID=A0A975CLU5_9BURK|nr:c-type cytochrome [Ottowia testudinis]